MEAELLTKLDDKIAALAHLKGRLEMWKEVAELMVPIRGALPDSFVNEFLRLAPSAKT